MVTQAEYYRQEEAEALQEWRQDDVVVRNMGYVSFQSRSKGRGRARRPVEVELYKYAGRSRTPRRFAFDEVAQELTGGRMGDEELQDYARRHCPPTGGRSMGVK